jgi:hypothetical protein
MKLAKLKDRKERGATIVEAAIVYGLLFLTLFAVLEFGLAFKDWLSVSHASREGARAGATYGDDAAAGFLILQDVGRHLGPAAVQVQQVRIYNADNPLSGTNYDYTPGANCAGVDCCDWTPCPDPDLPAPPYAIPGWNPTTRDVALPDTSTLGVEVSYNHQWITGFFNNSSVFTSVVEYHLEPQVFDSNG